MLDVVFADNTSSINGFLLFAELEALELEPHGMSTFEVVVGTSSVITVCAFLAGLWSLSI